MSEIENYKKWYNKNKESKIKKSKEYRDSHKEKLKESRIKKR